MDDVILWYIILSIAGTAVYFLPFMIAQIRRAEHQIAILWVNFLLGWTLFGWIAALIWAVGEKKSAQPVFPFDSVERTATDWEIREAADQKDRKVATGKDDIWILK